MPEWIGKTIGNVRIEKLLARGGMAEVYLGSHVSLERPVAVKLLHSFIEEEPVLLERFHREAKVVAGLRHPNIVQLFDFTTVEGHPLIVMEYLSGPTLATYLRSLHHRKKRLPPEQVARLLNQVSIALDYAHKQGVIHRDIKPGNIMLHSKTEEISLDQPLSEDVEAIITDFGLVRVMNSSIQTASGTVSGTPAYMSPEQVRGDTTDHRTDIYSLGIVLYELLAGRVPFEGDSTLTVLHMQVHTPPPPIPGLPAQVQAVIDRALAKNPADRHQTSRELAIDYYRSIGMTVKTDTIRGPYLVRALPPEAPPTLKPEPESVPVPPTTPEPSPTLDAPAWIKPEQEPEPVPAPQPQPRSEPKPSRSRGWIPALLFSLLGLSLLGVAGYLILPRIKPAPVTTEMVTPLIPSTGTSPSPSETPGISLPAATGMVRVDAGTYELGKDPPDAYHNASQSITLSEFWIDQYQVTNNGYQLYDPNWTIPPGEENHPVRGVTWSQADAYCRSLNKRLPSEAEWEAAGRGLGPEPQLYPWGTDANAGGHTLQLPNDNTYEVGAQAFNVSPVGVYDMVGNVWEWVGDPYGGVEDGKLVLRGSRYSLIYDLAFRLQVAADDTSYSPDAGFRCAANQISE